ncbi:MAG: dihydroneopterin aldolase [Gammaproteobacteria bacterium]|nr:dihydroneopterin aldolase [Gammaproteobacteria bacterium]MCW5582889.1 dihydroneopterin aldolase [Gammaproteobacteria bacterium]
MPTKKLYSTLLIRNLELNINLGWRNRERKQEQAVLLDITIRFPQPPTACKSDQLEDTHCYATLIDDIRGKLAEKNFRLIEHLSAEIYAIAKAQLPKKTMLNIRITKYPKIKGLTNGVCFDYGDEKTSW